MRAAVLLLAGTLLVGCTDLSRPPAPTPTQPAPAQPTATRPPAGATAVQPGVWTPVAPVARPVQVTPTIAAFTGGPISINDVQGAWSARGLTVSSEQAGPVSGFTVTPSALRVAKGSDASSLLVFTYQNQRALEEDWNVSGTPAPKPGKNAGTYNAVWWNQNLMVLVRARGDTSDDDARDAFLALGPAVSPVGPQPLATSIPTSITPSAGGVTPVAPPPSVPTATAPPPAVTPTPVRTPTGGPTLAPPR